MPLYIHTSNLMEHLVDRLEKVVRAPRRAPCTPFDKELIVVQSKGMQRWLSMELAARIGVWANGEFLFPNRFVERVFATVLPDAPEEAPLFAPEVMTWRILGLLQQATANPGFEEIAAYLSDDADGLKRMQLAQRVADTFDRYTVYRPEKLLEWEQGKEEHWQAQLWRALTAEVSQKHRARLLQEFRKALDGGRLPDRRRISVIGIPSLPPFHLEVLARLARHAEVNLFLLNPCRQYWGEIVSERELARLEKQGQGQEQWYETGNPLLASWGKLGRDFFEAIIDGCGEHDRHDSFGDLPQGSLLHEVQADIVELRGADAGVRTLTAGDLSLQVHSCHSPMREVEVLYDTLLSIFDADPSLSPRDVLVMTPDIESYAPYISAVFGNPESGAERIPYSIADRSLKNEGEAAQALLSILGLCGGRYGVATVLDILESAPVARRFGLNEDELETVRDWLRGANIRWGIDARQRAEHGVPPFHENSWSAGLDRLLLGYAMNGDGRSFYKGILPFDDMEGGVALVLGRFLSFCEKLFVETQALSRPRPAAEWVPVLRRILDDFILPDQEGERELLSLIEIVKKLGECGSQAGFEDGIGLEVVRYWVEQQLGSSERGLGFLTGGVTFCAMLPMRSIPFPVVALIGMDEGQFPRKNPAQGFDLMTRERRAGDRSPRDEDRYLFLEALLSARKRLHISYVGQSIKDNAELPPCVLVSELQDYLARCFVTAEGKPAGESRRHPLQPFSPRYFTGADGHFSYSQQNCAGAQAKLLPPVPPAPFLATPLPPWEEASTITLKSLVDFLCNPSKELLRRRLGVRIVEGDDPLEEVEPFALDSLEKYQLEQEIVAAVLRGDELELPFAVACARGDLPPGVCGAALYQKLGDPAAEFAGKVTEVCTGTALPALDIDLKLPAGRIIGRLENLRDDRMVRYRYTDLKPKDLLRLWVEHLVLNSAQAAGYPLQSTFVAAKSTVHLPAIDGSEAHLNRLLELYQEGMTQPLKFFPDTSFEYVKNAREPKNAAKALGAAAAAWNGSEYKKGDVKDEYCRRCFGESPPLDEEFQALAREVWDPILDNLVKSGKSAKKK
ncbi:exodeoxyribonuclease V subunit gamma [Geomonas paludis]|uniref:Exodeoxyribonuclease V subunit gamma n=1 Tax=Geomonas paludis TaxID=2740185 RepID=A0A6V8MRS2_9BACT|nr:exodeoxyribonuclease V subunit gamma [Geomonas paludis]UPU35719.1 exodeoxyribonuclease V subunit gamma [Geomonas paludis]GFO62702.1 RecBCD enzyme subunit RecC [Geomonas paludis]